MDVDWDMTGGCGCGGTVEVMGRMCDGGNKGCDHWAEGVSTPRRYARRSLMMIDSEAQILLA